MDHIIEIILSQAGMAGALLIPVVWALVHLAKQVKLLQDAAVTREKEHAEALAKQGEAHRVVVQELTSDYTEKLEESYAARTLELRNDAQVATTTFLDLNKQNNVSQGAVTETLADVKHTLTELRRDLSRRISNNTPRPGA